MWVGTGGGSQHIGHDAEGNAIALWRQYVNRTQSNIWANRYLAPDSLLNELRNDLQSAQGSLAGIQDDLRATKDELADERAALDSANAGVADLGTMIVLLIGFQAAFVASTVLLSFLYWNQRRQFSEFQEPKSQRVRSPKTASGGGVVKRGRPRSWGETDVSDREKATEQSSWPRTRGPLRLTTKERILLHLSDRAVGEDAVELPQDLTTVGIAEGVGVARRHVAQYLRPLLQEELVVERTASVKGALQRRKVYLLTERGRRSAFEIRDRIRAAAVPISGCFGATRGPDCGNPA